MKRYIPHILAVIAVLGISLALTQTFAKDNSADIAALNATVSESQGRIDWRQKERERFDALDRTDRQKIKTAKSKLCELGQANDECFQ